MNRIKMKKLVLTALFVALGIVLPFLTGQIKEIGDSLLPMHFVVLFCGLICGYKYGAVSGLLLPFLRSVLFSMPPLYPNAVWMSLELMTYGFIVGFIYNKFSKKDIKAVYISLAVAMIFGRIVWGISKTVLLGFLGKSFTFYMFITGGIIDAVPGIIIQLTLIPAIMKFVNKKGDRI